MLTYFQNSDSKNVVDDATRTIDSYVSRVKNLPEVEAGYMTLGDWVDDIIAERVNEKVDAMNLEYIKILLETVQEYHGTKENAVSKIQEKFPEYTDQAKELVEKYWKES